MPGATVQVAAAAAASNVAPGNGAPILHVNETY